MSVNLALVIVYTLLNRFRRVGLFRKEAFGFAPRTIKGPSRGLYCSLANLPIITAGLAYSLFGVFTFGLVSSFGFLPYKVGHAKGAYGGHYSSGVIHVTPKADAVRFCAASFADVGDRHIFTFALGANHFQLSSPI